ncbi:MAG: tetratricopeptide repeat protein [Candidatus Thiosymbion ectosymbiont of Robbea hypermnestra]|nr:tetratricopeptide repeat protein [Candidatus Thiosymbion ectosymbiont of Robbea hypermnestra]
MEAEAGFQRLAKRQPDAYRPEWARSLGNLASYLSDLGRFQEAMEQARESEEIHRELAKRQPDAYRPGWASSLDNLASHLSDLGRFQEAMEQARTAEGIYRGLAECQPDAYRPDWARSLAVLAASRLGAGDFAGAINLSGQAIDQFQGLSPERRRTLDDRVGWAHRIRAEALLGDGKPVEAHGEAAKSSELLGGVFAQRPGVAAEELARANLARARCLKSLDRPAEGATHITETLQQLLPLIEPQGARLRGVLHHLLDELQALAPDAIHAAPAAEIAAALGPDNQADPTPPSPTPTETQP